LKGKIVIVLLVVAVIIGAGYGSFRAKKQYIEQTAIAESKGDFATAIKHFNKVVLIEQLNPINMGKPTAAAHSYRGRLYFNNGEVNKALEDLNTAVKMDKQNAEAHFGIALIRLQEGDLKQAEKELTIVIKASPKWVEPYLSRSVAYRKLGDKDKAIADLKKVMKLDPKNAAAKTALDFLE
jgi:tetratricopeptide (TPR) repeat protein